MNALDYYLGPTGIPDKVRAFADLANYINPVNAFGQMMQSSRNLFHPDSDGWGRVQSAGDMLSGMAGVVAPAALARWTGATAANALQEGLTGLGSSPAAGQIAEDVGRYWADEDGAIRAWHGSPHDFDRFSMDKIGTGEGAQAYGHGLYFAESPGVARSYQEALANRKYMPGDGPSPLKSAWSIVGASADRAAMPTDELLPYVKSAWPNVPDDEIRAAIEEAKSAFSPGRLYEVNIDANPEDFLDWDAPLSAQPEGFYNALSKQDNRFSILGPDGKFAELEPLSEDQASEFIEDYRRGYARRGGNPEDYRIVDLSDKSQAPNRPIYEGFDVRSNTQSLARQGIPGIRYLDAGSRTAGDGSRNYVVFDDNMIDILGRDGSRNTPQGRAQNVLDYLTSGRASEVTDEMLEGADPQYLYRNYDLPMDYDSRMYRADEMGFPVHKYDGESYHLTPNDVQAFNVGHTSTPGHPREAVWARTDPRTNPAAHNVGRDFSAEGANDMPLYISGERAMPFEARDMPDGEYLPYAVSKEWAEEARRRGYSQYELGNERLSIDPTRIRSRFARFDPRLAHLRNLSAGIGALGLFGDYDQRDNALDGL